MKNFNPQNQKNVLNLHFENFFNKPISNIMDRMFKNLSIAILLFLASSLWNSMHASHLMGADITYKEVDTNTGRYLITVRLYRDCNGVGMGAAQLRVRSALGNSTVTMDEPNPAREVTPICLPPDVAVKPATGCPGTTTPPFKGVMEHTFTKEVTLGKSNWALVGVEDFCRNGAITTINPTCVGIWVQAVIDTRYRNSSPVFTTNPVPYWCKLRLNTYNHGTIDTIDNPFITLSNGVVTRRDSLVYRLYRPFTNEAANINQAVAYNNPGVNFVSPLNTNNFLFTTNGVYVDPKSGTISCIPSIEQDAIMAMSVQEWRAIPVGANGYTRVMIGYVCRDLQFTVRNTCPPIVPEGIIEDSLKSANKITTTNVDICGSRFSQVSFKIIGAPAETLKYKILETPNTFNVINFQYNVKIDRKNNVDTLIGTLTFDSTKGIGTEYFKLEAYYCTTIGVKVSEFYTLVINFRPSVVTHKSTLYYCNGGKPARSFAKGGTKYRWSPKAGIVRASGADSIWVDLAPAATTTYIARAYDGIDSTQSCSVVDSVKVLVIPKFNYSLAPKVSDLCLHDTVKVNLALQSSNNPYKIKWTDPVAMGSIYGSNNKLTTDSASPKIIAQSSATYVVEMVDKFECTLYDSIRINMNGVRSVATGLSARKVICPGDTTMLSVTVKPKTNGPSIYTCTAAPIARDVKTAVPATMPSTGACAGACYPNPFNTASGGNSSTSRFIYTKAELNTAGVRAGTLKSIAFNVSAVANPTIDSFELRMAGTTLTNSTAFADPMFTVYKMARRDINIGWDNKFTIPGNGFDWDGESNIIIETHAMNKTTQSVGNSMRTLLSTTGAQTSYKVSNTVGVMAENAPGSYIAAGGGITSKPELRIEYCTVDSTNVAILNSVWQPAALITNVSNPRAIAKVTQIDSVFVATVGTNACFDTALVRLNIDKNFKVSVNPGKRVYCAAGNINLSATVTGSPTTTMNWTSIPATGAGLPAVTNTSAITVNPGVGTWRYVISAADGPCNATDTVTITVQPNIPLSLKIDSSLCTASNGKIKAILPAGSLADSFNFVWKKNGATFGAPNRDSAVNLAPDTYSLDISLKSDASCTGTSSGVLSAKMDTITSNILTSGIRCKDSFADSIWVAITSTTGSGSYHYSWNPSSGASDTFYKKTMVPDGLYQVTISDRITGCQGRKSFNHTEPTQLAITLDNLIPNPCKGDNKGQIKVSGTGGTITGGGYTYQWSGINALNAPIPNFNELIGLYADSLCVTVTDMNNCTVAVCHKVTEPAKSLTIDSMRRVCATVVNGTDGTATAYISGGTPNFTYKWVRSNGTVVVNPPNGVTSPLTSNTINGLNKQMYSLTVTDQSGCKASDSIMLCDVICNMKGAFRTDSVLCKGDSTGKIHFAAIDSLNYASTNWYKYTVYNGPSQVGLPIQNNLGWDTARFTVRFGSYDVRVETDKGCDTIFKPIFVGENPAFTFVPHIQQKPSCYLGNDGEIHVQFTNNSNSSPPYQYNFGAGWINDSFSKTMVTTINGTYQVRDRHGCVAVDAFTIPKPDTISVTNGSIQTNCKDSLTKGLIEFVVIPSNPDSIGNFRFYNKPGIGLRAADTMNGFTDSILGPAGTRSMTIWYQNLNTAGKRCSYVHNYQVTEPDPIVLTKVNKKDVTCSYDMDGKFDFELRTGERGNPLTGAETYSYEIRKNGILINQKNVTNTAESFINLDSGIYTLKVSDAKGCTHSFTDTVKKPDTLRVGFSLPVDANCIEVKNGSVAVNSYTGGNGAPYTYVWEKTSLINGATVPLGLPDTTSHAINLEGLARYKVTVSDIKGCTATRETVIDTLYQLRITKVTVDSARCYGEASGKITINSIYPATAPVPFEYNFNNEGFTSLNSYPAAAGTYTYIVKDAVGCPATGTSTIHQPADIVILGTVRNATCHVSNGPADGSIKITYTGGNPPYSTPVWNAAPNQQFTDSAIGLSGGVHTVVVVDVKGCSKPKTFEVLQPEPMIATVDRYKDITCFAADNGEIDIKVVGGFPNLSYAWNHGLPNSAKQTNLKPGINNQMYRVTVTDANGCTATASKEIKEPLKLDFESILIDSVTCPKYKDGVINVLAKDGTPKDGGGYDYSIDGGATFFSGGKFTSLAGKDYNVVIRDKNGCIAAKKLTVVEPDEPYFTAHRDSTAPDTLTMGNMVGLYYTPLKTNLGYTYDVKGINWTPSMALSCADCARPKATPFSTTMYEVELTYHNECKAKAKVNVPVYDPLDFFVPSAFTPGNGDGLNDKLFLYGNGIKKMSLLIFNRWGEKIFEANHITQGWDGIYKNEAQPSGVYSFSAEVEYLNGEKRTKKGSITLVR